MRNVQFLRSLCVALCLSFVPSVLAAERLKPFVLASVVEASLDQAVTDVRTRLAVNNFEILGEYRPYEGAAVVIATNDELKSVSQEDRLAGFASTIRVGFSESEQGVQVSYLNPEYLAAAYRLESDLEVTRTALETGLGAQEVYGSSKGLTEKKLRKYHYTFGMEYFDDPYKLASYESQEAAIAAVEAGLAANTQGVGHLYRLDLPRENASVFGVSMGPGVEADQYRDDAFQMSIVDFGDIKSTAYLPYQVLVSDGEVLALHMRFRMAVHFPDLSMMGKHSFMTLMPSPKAIEKALKGAVAGE